jgi:hypothetical protein
MAYKQKKAEPKKIERKKKKERQATIFDFGEDHIPKEEEINVDYEDLSLEDFETYEERPKRELTSNEKLVLSFFKQHDHWDDLSKPMIVFEKAKLNVYAESLGIFDKWLIDFGIFLCALCRKDGQKHKLQKVKYIGHICKECGLKYQTQIRELMKSANAMMRLNASKRD